MAVGSSSEDLTAFIIVLPLTAIITAMKMKIINPRQRAHIYTEISMYICIQCKCGKNAYSQRLSDVIYSFRVLKIGSAQ